MKFEVTGIVREIETSDIVIAASAAEAKEKFVKTWGKARKVKAKKL